MSSSLLDAFSLVAHSEQLQLRLDAAAVELAKVPALVEEKAWLDVARQRVGLSREGTSDLPLRALRLPELDSLKGEYARILQGAAVDALERLHAGIAFAGGPRAPLLEALYWKLKLPALRRCDREEFEKFSADFDKRLKSTYARRMFGDPAYQVVGPALEAQRQAFATWRSVFTSRPLTDAEAEAVESELTAAARALEVPCRQARLLAQAALAPLKELLESSGVAQRPKRRGPRVAGSDADDETHPLLETDPADPNDPTADEREELAAAQASSLPFSAALPSSAGGVPHAVHEETGIPPTDSGATR